MREFEQPARAASIQLESQKIAKNPSQCALAKMMLNCMRGEFGQQTNKMQVKEFAEPQVFCQFKDSDQHDVRYVSSLNKDRVEAHYRKEALCDNVSPNLNIFIACFTTCWVGLRLDDVLERLNDRVFYFDSDSVICVHRPDKVDPMLDDNLGDFTDELGNGQFIVEFCSGGLKNYGYRCNNGITARKIVRDAKAYAFYTQAAHKDYHLVFNKRVLDPRTGMTYPYGCQFPDTDDVGFSLFYQG